MRLNIIITTEDFKEAMAHCQQQFIEEGTERSYVFDKNISDSWQWINENLPSEPIIISNSFVTSYYQLSYTFLRFGAVTAQEEIRQSRIFYLEQV